MIRPSEGAIQYKTGMLMRTEASFEGGQGAVAPKQKEKKKKERKKEKKEKREKKEKKERREITTCCFFQFFNSPVALKNLKKFGPPRKS